MSSLDPLEDPAEYILSDEKCTRRVAEGRRRCCGRQIDGTRCERGVGPLFVNGRNVRIFITNISTIL